MHRERPLGKHETSCLPYIPQDLGEYGVPNTNNYVDSGGGLYYIPDASVWPHTDIT
jgi:hypothetical protein